MERSAEYYCGLVRELCKHPHEVEWVEFKESRADLQETGEYISALANSAALNGKISAYLIWGIRDNTHEIVGTDLRPFKAKKGNEPLESWLLRLLNPKIHFRFHELKIDEKPVVLLEIDRASRHPVRFSERAYIRIGEVKKPLKEAPDRERQLWRIFDQTPFEEMLAAERISEAVLFAKRLSKFKGLRRKAIRVIQYRGSGRTETLKEQIGEKGYAAGFEGLLSYINGLIPTNEIIGQALRKTVPMFPELAVREMVANTWSCISSQPLYSRCRRILPGPPSLPTNF